MAKHRDERDPDRVPACDLRFGDCINDNNGLNQAFVIGPAYPENRGSPWVDVIAVARRGARNPYRHLKAVEHPVALEKCSKKTMEAVVRKAKEEHDEALADVARWEEWRVALDRLLEDSPPPPRRKRRR